MATQFMEANIPDGTVRPFPTGSDLLPNDERFAALFNRHDFEFDHGLANHPLFSLESLLGLAQRIPKYQDFVYWQNGRVRVNDRWESNPAPRLSLEDTILGVAGNDSLVILKHAEQDPLFGPVLQEILQRIFSFTSPAAQDDIILGESLIFINSPNRTTAYHLDLESNFLLQVTGEKLCHVHDCADRAVTPHSELENHCGGDYNAARFKADLTGAAHHYRLTPGHGVHFPSTAPHWVENCAGVSVSINIHFDLVSVHQRKRPVYFVNRILRRVGLDPTPPGVSPWRDTIKTAAAGRLASLLATRRRAARAEPAARAYPVWRPTRNRASGTMPP